MKNRVASYTTISRRSKVREEIPEFCLTKSENHRIMRFLKKNGEYRFVKPQYRSLYEQV